MEKLFKMLSANDKLKHMLVSLLCMLWFTALGKLLFPWWVAITIASLITILTGVTKELNDSSFSKEDLLADCIGWLCGLIPLIVLAL